MDNTTHNNPDNQSTFENLFNDAKDWLDTVSDTAESKTDQWTDEARSKVEELKGKYHEWKADISDDDLVNKMSERMNEFEAKAKSKGYKAKSNIEDAMN